MIKRIIFDIDNTLFDTYKDCIDTYNEVIKIYKLNVKGQEIYNIIDLYDKNKGNYIMGDLALFISNKLNIKFSEDDVVKMLEIYGRHATLLNNNTYDILKYLSSKYEIVCLSNWYNDNQWDRLKKVKIDKFISYVYGFNEGHKPDKDVFIKACGKYSFDEVLMIGDSEESDIVVPYNMG